MPRLACPKCKTILKVTAAAPKKVRCPKCRGTFRLAKKQPAADAVPALPPAKKSQPVTKLGGKFDTSKQKPKTVPAPPRPPRTRTTTLRVEARVPDQEAEAKPIAVPQPNPRPAKSSPKPTAAANDDEDGSPSRRIYRWLAGIIAVVVILGVGWRSLDFFRGPPLPTGGKVDPKLLQQRIPKPPVPPPGGNQ